MYKLIRPLLFMFDPESVHNAILALAKYIPKEVGRLYKYENEKLRTNVADIEFPNPIGLAAGFDKNAELIDFLPLLGFGFVEIGSVTAKSCIGNPKPRLFRRPKEKAIINRMGLNNIGADAVYEQLRDKKLNIPLGINIAKTNDPRILRDKAIEDIRYTVQKLSPFANYITINISCPNTKEGKTFEEKKALEELLGEIKSVKPIFLKLSSMLSYRELDDILTTAEGKVKGYVISNTLRHELGGMSGKPLRQKATDIINYIYTYHNQPNIIGVGGIFSAEDAYEKICAGASLVQVYTGLIYEGPCLVKKIKKGLVKLLERDGFSSVKDAVGVNKIRKK